MGSGAISIIRVSGKDALEFTDSVISFKDESARSSQWLSIKYGIIPEVDEVLVSIFRSPIPIPERILLKFPVTPRVS